MGDAVMDKTTKPNAPINATSPKPAFKIPNIEMPAAILELAEKGGAQVKDNYEKMRTMTEEMTGVVEATFATASKGGMEYGLKVLEMTRANTTAAFDFISKF